jgi:anti-anti-sigma regulatory factor
MIRDTALLPASCERGYFVVDASEVSYMDSTTLGNMVSVPVRLSLRVSELAIIYPSAGKAKDILEFTGIARVFPSAYATLGEALSKILCKPVESIEPLLKFEERLSIDRDGGVRDYGELLERPLRKSISFWRRRRNCARIGTNLRFTSAN